MISIATIALKRYLRDRSNLFFVFVLPFLIIFLVGYSVESQSGSPIALVESDSELFVEILTLLTPGSFEAFDAETAALEAVENNSAAALVTVSGDTISVRTKPGKGFDARAEIDAVVATINRRLQTEAAGQDVGADRPVIDQALAIAPTPVEVVATGDDAWGGLDNLAASSLTQTVLFMFLAALTAASFLVEDRHLGMAARKATAPITPTRIIAGEALGRLLITLFQAALIVSVTWLLFEVGWGNPIATSATIGLFALAATGAGMLLGTVVDRADAANAIGITGALVLAALGGAMAPVEVFPDAMQTIARATPHFWAIDGLQTSLTGGVITDVVRPLAVLSAYAVTLLALAVIAFRRRVFHR